MCINKYGNAAPFLNRMIQYVKEFIMFIITKVYFQTKALKYK